MYMQGPWPEAETTQGYQLPLTPREVYHIGIIRTNEYVQKKYGKTFESISSTAHQDEILQALESGEAGFEDFSSKVFFEMLLANTIEGYFGDPMYGGNRNKVGWRLVGFPGAAAAYVGLVAKHNVPYSVTPMGIGDLQQQEAAMGPETQADADHMARMHIMLGRRALGLEK
jgi:gluconate 2-dehydrogenase gamma chain